MILEATNRCKPAIFSFFSGVGFLDLGFENKGFEVKFVNEIHKAFLDGYKHSRRKLKYALPEFGYWDTDVSIFLNPKYSKELKKFVKQARKESGIVGFIGGPPCPDFSIGGKNRGRKGENGRLSGTYVEIICQQKPDFFIFENVKGLWRTAKHRCFYEQLKTKVKNAGFNIVDKLINAIEYGTPQDRDRIIMMGFHKNLSTKKVQTIVGLEWEKSLKFKKEKVFNLPWPQTNSFGKGMTACPNGLPLELTVQHWFEKNEVSNHPNTGSCFRPKAALSKFQKIDEGDDSKKSFKRLHRWRYSPTACYGNNEVHLHPYLPRRINAAEALAIQSLPREYELPTSMTLTDMFKSIGNGVPYLAAKGLAKQTKEFVEQLI